MDYKKTKTKEIYTKLPRNHPLNLHTHPHTNADWTPTDHYHWWHMMDLFNWSLIANDVMDRKMNMHWSRAARYDRRKRHYKAFSIESFKSCTMIYRRNIYAKLHAHQVDYRWMRALLNHPKGLRKSELKQFSKFVIFPFLYKITCINYSYKVIIICFK